MMLNSNSSLNSHDAIEQFRAALEVRGLAPPEIIPDGCIHRCGTVDEPRGKNGAYVLHLDNWPAGGFQNHRDGLGWQVWSLRSATPLSPQKSAAIAAARRAASERRDLERICHQDEVAARAGRMWQRATLAGPNHPYLQVKGIRRYVARQQGDLLVLPVCNAQGEIRSLQFIGPDGAKRFLAAGQKRGCYCPIGHPTNLICIAEGFATGASIHEATGYAVAVAFDAGNLLPVGKALRAKFPDHFLRFCADDDRHTPGNPGRSYALAAAAAVGGTVVLPHFGEDTP